MQMMMNDVENIFQSKYGRYIKSLKEISYDDTNKQYLSTLDNKCFCYDDIMKEIYCSEDTVASPDAIFFSDKAIFFIEFKNGEMTKGTKKQLKIKGIEGGYIGVFDTLNKNKDTYTFDIVRDIPKKYIIVYNENKNGGIDKILGHYTKKFGLTKYEGTFFETIRVMTQKDFDRKFKTKKLVKVL